MRFDFYARPMVAHTLRALFVAASLALAACGSGDATTATEQVETAGDDAAVSDTTVESSDTTETAVDPDSETSSTTETEPDVADDPPVLDELDGEIADQPLAGSVFTEADLASISDGRTWEIDQYLESAEPASGIVVCDEELPSMPARISLTADSTDGELEVAQEVFLAPDQAWVDAFRLLASCEDSEEVLGPVELTIVPATVRGTEDAVVIEAFEPDVSLPHTIVVVAVTSSHTMLVSVEASTKELLDLDAIVSMVEQAVARSN